MAPVVAPEDTPVAQVVAEAVAKSNSEILISPFEPKKHMSVPLSELVMLPIMQESSRAALPVPSISSTTTSTSSKDPSELRACRKARKAARKEAGTYRQAAAKKAVEA